MADQKYPELVTQSSHGVGLSEEQSFEDTLRELVRASPYLFISLLLHGIVGFIFYLMPAPERQIEEVKTIKASAEEFEEPIPPEEPEPEEEIEEIEEIIEEPVVTEDVVTEVTEVIDNTNVDAAFDSTGLNDAIGIGGGGGGGFGKLGRRGSKGKRAGEASEQAVDLALKWLSNHQSDLGGGAGYWSGASFDLECGRNDPDDNNICDGLAGSAQHDVGLTGLALLAFLGAGNTDKEGKYKDTVKKGLRYLIEQQESDGCLASKTIQDYTYDHIIATLALTEAYALTNRRTLKKPAQKALEFMYSIRNPGAAWRYADFHPEMLTHENDVSVTGWAVLAMSLAKEYKNLPFEEDALTDSMIFIEEMTDDVGRTGYIERGGYPARLEGKDETWPSELSESMTAVGILCRIFADPEFKNPENRDQIEKGVKLILDKPLVWDEEDSIERVDFYYWYYATYALYQFSADPAGAQAWKTWERDMVGAILKNQIKEGEPAGSWDPQVDPWGSIGGRVYSTAILALCMEVFYRYDTVIGSHSGGD